ncbi:RING finger protein 17-like [Magallana gigas]|uniref:RING finger protein 17-like n=1 Tax=Magallana gigas TaxID=29159 RepID=UPI00333FC47E
MTFLGEDGSVCVQHEDSAIFQITQQIDAVESGPVPDLEDLQPGRFVAALYITETEKLWSRAEVISRDGTTVDVLFIDYGNSGSCSQNSIRFLTEELAQYPMQIIYCYLHGVAPLEDAETWSKEFKERFAEIVTDQELIAITRDIPPDGTHIVDLFLTSDPSTSINDRLVAEGILRKLTDEEQDVVTSDDEPEELELPTDTNQWDIYVSFINSSTNSVMIRLVGEKYSDKLEELEKKLEEVFHSSEEDVEIAEGQVCVAYVDELYHRVRVIKKEPLKAAVYMVDFGEFIVMSIEDIRLLPYCFAQLPQLAFKGNLFSIKPTKESKVWSEAAKYKFLQMAHNKSLVALSCGTEDVMGQEVTLMRLVDTSQQDQDICLDDELLEMGVAEKIRPLS